MATIIQRWWRGFYSRKHVHDYYARKRYLAQVKERNHQIRAELNIEAERAIIMQRQVRVPHAPWYTEQALPHQHWYLVALLLIVPYCWCVLHTAQ